MFQKYKYVWKYDEPGDNFKVFKPYESTYFSKNHVLVIFLKSQFHQFIKYNYIYIYIHILYIFDVSY